MSEEPVSGVIPGRYVRGLQEKGRQRDVEAFCVHDMESERMDVDSLVTQRAIHGMYLLFFTIATLLSRPRAVMASYGRVNVTAESYHVLQ